MTIAGENFVGDFSVAKLLAGEPYEARRQLILDASGQFLNSHLERIRQMSTEGASGTAVVQELTAIFDQLSDILFQVVSADLDPDAVANCALFALGGYGRREMNPKSDLDLMFFFAAPGQEAIKVISDRMLY
ncbi:MAG: hypothetical protein KAT20_04115, partial [Desulfuromonadales bacterium]|nr:hypothetical protein [Desulfuromonadales bacterium]